MTIRPEIYLISNPTKPTHRRLSFKNDMTTFEKGLGWVSELVNGGAVDLPVREAMAWPCEIETADFEQDTITLKMKSSDYKVSAGQHWLSTSAKQEQGEPEPVAMRYDFDGYGYKYIDVGSGSDWQTRIKNAEPMYSVKTYFLTELHAFQEATGCDTADEFIAKQEQGAPVKWSDYESNGVHHNKPSLAKQDQRNVRALADSEHTGEPVAVFDEKLGRPKLLPSTTMLKNGQKLYTTPQQRKPLTKEQILALWEDTYVQRGRTGIEFARAIEVAHGIKE